MRVVMCPDSFKGSLSARQAATVIEEGFATVFPDATYVRLPVSDGGEGLVDALLAGMGGEVHRLRVTGPVGEPVDAWLGLQPEGRLAIVEMSAAAGLHLVPAGTDPRRTTTRGVGELIRYALAHDVDHVVLGLGGSGTNDGGLGMLQALGVEFIDANGRALVGGSDALSRLARIEASGIDPRLSAIRLEVACDVDNPLCGPQGASQVFGPQKGATPAMAQEMDAGLSNFANVIHDQFGTDVRDVPGAGAAGGLGAAVVGILGVPLYPGIELVIEWLGLRDQLRSAQLVITGEGRLDGQTVRGKAPVGIARIAREYDVPVIAIAGSVSPDAVAVHEHGIDAVFSVIPEPCDVSTAMAVARENLRTTATNVARALRIGAALRRR